MLSTLASNTNVNPLNASSDIAVTVADALAAPRGSRRSAQGDVVALAVTQSVSAASICPLKVLSNCCAEAGAHNAARRHKLKIVYSFLISYPRFLKRLQLNSLLAVLAHLNPVETGAGGSAWQNPSKGLLGSSLLRK
jgi:hypothetical protein